MGNPFFQSPIHRSKMGLPDPTHMHYSCLQLNISVPSPPGGRLKIQLPRNGHHIGSGLLDFAMASPYVSMWNSTISRNLLWRDVALHFSLVVSRIVILQVSFRLPHRTYLPLVFPESTKPQTTELPAQFFSLIEEYMFPPVFRSIARYAES